MSVATADEVTNRDKTALLVVLAVVAGIVLAVDFLWLTRVGSVAVNAVGASLAGIGGVLLMFGGTSSMGLSKRKWREGFVAVGGLLVGLGGLGVAVSAWIAFFEQTGPIG